MTSDAPPHSRWLIRESIDRLAASYDAVTVAVDALTRSAVLRSSAGDGPTIRQRITGGRGWARTVWFGVATLLTGLFMAWISVRLVRHLSVAPGIVTVLPGLLLALGLAVTASQAAKSLERPPEPGHVHGRGAVDAARGGRGRLGRLDHALARPAPPVPRPGRRSPAE